MSGYWIHDPANPFNQMDYTRGGGGRDNDQTRESNERRASAMMGSGVGALPRFADRGTALAHLARDQMGIVGDSIVKKTERTGTAAKPATQKTEQGSTPVVTAARAATAGTLAGAAARMAAFPGYYPGAEAPIFMRDRIGAMPKGDEDPRFSLDVPFERTGAGGVFDSMGAMSMNTAYFTGTGYRNVPSKDLKERIEDGPLEWLYMAEEYLLPSLGIGRPSRPPFLDPEYSHFDGGFFGKFEWREGKNPRGGYLNGSPTSYLTGGGF